MNKKGFTLIELLAVILILGVIALIAVPKVASAIDLARMNTFKISIGNVVKAVEQKCQLEMLKSNEVTNLYVFENGKSSIDLDMKGPLPDSGKIYVDSDCNVKINVIDEKFKAVKAYDDDEVIVMELSKDFIENLEFYYLGDSLIEGYGNNYRGISYYMESTYNTYTAKDYSISGSFLTQPSEKLTIYSQFTNMLNRMGVSATYGKKQ